MAVSVGVEVGVAVTVGSGVLVGLGEAVAVAGVVTVGAGVCVAGGVVGAGVAPCPQPTSPSNNVAAMAEPKIRLILPSFLKQPGWMPGVCSARHAVNPLTGSVMILLSLLLKFVGIKLG
ncbi:MAG: hypothetical protein U9R05_09630 [Chloroflexota bacterium]|nr:hypothetical protein [Chloroflexota bacterium]